METKLLPYKSKLNDIKIHQYYDHGKLLVSIETPIVQTRPPINIVLCIDVSYSMSNEATLKGEKNETVSHGISVLSLTISAAKTVLNSLNENDNISIVTFSAEAKVIVNNLPCSFENKKMIEMQLDDLKVISNTNMWAGLLQSLDILRENSLSNKNKGIILLTDGVPNLIPPRGHEKTLSLYFEQYNFKCMISCYGFGYELDSLLLQNISDISSGDGYSFIPDASILGSVFINGMSNLLSTAIYNPEIHIQLSEGILFKNGNSVYKGCINSLKYGRTKNLVFDIDMGSLPQTEGHLMKDNFSEVSLVIPGNVIKTNSIQYGDCIPLQRQRIRIETLDILEKCMFHKKYNEGKYKEIINEFNTKLIQYPKDEYIQNIYFDLSVQVKEALNMTQKGINEDWFSKWGYHYLISLRSAYSNELCNNFKDKGILNFKGPLFDSLCEEISTIFESIPPPKQDILKHRYRQSSKKIPEGTPSRHEKLQSMSVYNNAGGGCCIGESNVLMGDGYTLLPIKNIIKGQRVITCDPNNNFQYVVSEVECVIETFIHESMSALSTVSSNGMKLTLTPYHPIINNGKWTFPVSLSEPSPIGCKSVYTLIVKNRFPIVVQGFIYATLGHTLTGEVIGHDYLGSEKVINDLSIFKGYGEGYIALKRNNYIRGGPVGNIIKIEKSI